MAPRRAKLVRMTTRQVCHDIIMPITKRYQMSYCHMLRDGRIGQQFSSSSSRTMGKPATSATPSVFVSHAHSYMFLDAISALSNRFKDDLDVYLWFDLFSINQHLTTDWTFDWLANTFQSAIGEMGSVLMVLSPWNDRSPSPDPGASMKRISPITQTPNSTSD